MSMAVREYCKECEVCQQRSEPRHLYGELEPIALPAPGEMITIDFAGSFTKTDSGNTHILVIVDNGSKEAFLKATPDVTAETAARGIVEKYLYHKGVPRVISSDRGSAFTSALMKSLADVLGVKQQFSVAHHPQSHGQVENCIKTVERGLQAIISEHQRDWDKHLLRVEAAIRFSPSETTGVSPFAMQHGREAFLPIDRVLGAKNDARHHADAPKAVLELAKDIEETLKSVRKNVQKAQEKQKKHFDKNRKDVDKLLDVGCQVLMKKRAVEFEGISSKLQRAWTGPFRVIEKTSEVNRVIEHVNRQDGSKPINVHVSQLKPFIKPREERESTPEDHFEIQEIVGERERDGKVEYRVRWAGYSKRYDEWVTKDGLAAPDILRRWQERPTDKRREEKQSGGKRKKEERKEKGIKEQGKKDKAKERLPLGNRFAPLAELPVSESSKRAKTSTYGRAITRPDRYQG